MSIPCEVLVFLLIGTFFGGIQFVTPAPGSVSSALTLSGKINNFTPCKEAVDRLCGNQNLPDDLAVLDCIQNGKGDSDADINEACHSFLWQYKLNLTREDQFLDSAERMCSLELESSLKECNGHSASGHKMSCLFENSESIGPGQCKSFLVKIGSIIFSDYRLIERFTQACQGDITTFNCGRLDQDEEREHKQGSTIECLSQHVRDLSPECHLETLRVAEQQADDYHLDRPLFFACRDDRERFCRNIQAGQGRVYKCLTKNKLQNDMSNPCREQLTRRQKLISEDYKVSKGLVKACKEDIRTYECYKDASTVKDRKVKLAQILLCLENAMHGGEPVSGECRAEMLDHRKSLLEDYRLSPEVVASCQDDIKTLCRSKEIGGKTLHCLMKNIRKHNTVSDPCVRSLEDLLRTTDPGSDWQVDGLLKDACQPVVDSLCKNRDNPAGTLPCLMEKLYSESMTAVCQSALLEIQYFVARDFRLDSQLYSQCQKDAISLCAAPKNWSIDFHMNGPQQNPLVLPCLYRHAYHPKPGAQLTVECADEVRRVMKQRANTVDLIPELEEPCIQDLAQFCSDKTGRGEEMLCLQDHMDSLSLPCKAQVANYTEEEAEHLELNPIISTYCGRFLETHCQDEQDDGDEGEVMECLIDFKTAETDKMNSKCRSAIEHFQLISIKDFRFSAAFKKSCKADITRLCPPNLKLKHKVVACLSEMVRNDSLSSSPHRVSQPCRQQLRSQLQHQHEDVRLNPTVNEPCEQDEKRFCHDVKPGQGRVLECLKNHRKQLTDACHAAIFQIEKEEMEDSSVDFQLVAQCKDPIRRFCNDNPVEALECLKQHLEDMSHDPGCKQLVLKRMAQQNLDVRFNPVLRKACSQDIPKFCLKVWEKAPKDSELEGEVLNCLKESYVSKKRLSPSCADQITSIMKQQALHYEQDPVLVKYCGSDIQRLCSNEEENPGGVEECLKTKFENIESIECRRHVAFMITAVQIDIQADPVLHRTCAIDLLKNCNDVPAGEGRKLKCLMRVKEQTPTKMEPKCAEMLGIRSQLFSSAAQVMTLESVNDLVDQLTRSPSRNHFLAVGLALVAVIFLIGIVCGRVSRRHRVLKDK